METSLATRSKDSLTAPKKTLGESLIAGQIGARTKKAYLVDIAQFIDFIGGEDRLCSVDKDAVLAYREYLCEYSWETSHGTQKRYSPSTINRKLSVVRQLLAEAADRGMLDRNPAARLKGLTVNRDYSPTQGLSRQEARLVLDSIDTATLIGKRDYALLNLMIRTGLRREEVANLTLSSVGEREGHKVLTVVGKGNKRRLIKLPVDVWRSVEEWVTSVGVTDPQSPLFFEVRKTGRGAEARYVAGRDTGITTDGIWYIVRRRVREAGITANITPHSLRHVFITLALAGGAPLHKVQYAAGHADPRTTERYDRRRDDLDDNAVDYVKL